MVAVAGLGLLLDAVQGSVKPQWLPGKHSLLQHNEQLYFMWLKRPEWQKYLWNEQTYKYRDKYL